MGLVQIAPGHAPDVTAAGVLEALDHLRVAITLFDGAETLVYFNSHYSHLFRSFSRPQALIGCTYEELIRLEIAGGEIAEHHALDAEGFVTARRRQLHDGDFRPFDIQLADGRIIELKSRRANEGRWIVLWSDATIARRLLARLEDTVKLSVDAFAFWDDRDRLSLCNSVFADLHGFAACADAQGLSFAEVTESAAAHGKFTIEGPAASWLERRMDAHTSPAGALTVSTPAGAYFLVRERATRGGGSVTVLTDVSERHRAESALVEQSRTLEHTRHALQKSKSEAKRNASYLADLTRRLDAAESEVDTAKSTLLRTMSHELKTPLNAIIGFADLLRSSPERFAPCEIGEYAGLIHVAGGNLLRLINEILDLTKIAAGRYTLRREPLAVPSALRRALEQHAALLNEKSIAADMAQCAPQLVVDADETALNVMLGHLVENAARYTPRGGAVRLSAATEGELVRITVSDNGPGVAVCDLERVLRPFEQVVGATLDHNSGAGLGLPLVKALAEVHGGALKVSSIPGEGFTATIELPRV